MLKINDNKIIENLQGEKCLEYEALLRVRKTWGRMAGGCPMQNEGVMSRGTKTEETKTGNKDREREIANKKHIKDERWTEMV